METSKRDTIAQGKQPVESYEAESDSEDYIEQLNEEYSQNREADQDSESEQERKNTESNGSECEV